MANITITDSRRPSASSTSKPTLTTAIPMCISNSQERFGARTRRAAARARGRPEPFREREWTEPTDDKGFNRRLQLRTCRNRPTSQGEQPVSVHVSRSEGPALRHGRPGRISNVTVSGFRYWRGTKQSAGSMESLRHFELRLGRSLPRQGRKAPGLFARSSSPSRRLGQR